MDNMIGHFLDPLAETEEYYVYIANLIDIYFEGKDYSIGGPIPHNQLFSTKSIQTVLRCNFVDCVDFIHEEIMPKLNLKKIPGIPVHSDYIIRMIDEMKALKIPPKYRGGMMLLYFKLCKGFKIPDPPRPVFSIKEEEEYEEGF